MGGNVSHVLSLDDWDNHFDQVSVLYSSLKGN